MKRKELVAKLESLVHKRYHKDDFDRLLCKIFDVPKGSIHTNWDAFKDAFTGQEATFEKLNEMINSQLEKDRTLEDLPSSWFAEISGAMQTLVNGGNKNQSEDTLPARMQAAVEKGFGNKPIQITMMLEGQVVADYVNTIMGAQLGGLIV